MDGNLDAASLTWMGARPYRRPPRRIAIIGGGASGVIAAANLARAACDDTEIVLIERRRELGRGLAYSTRQPDHLLNVRAANMSAFADDPDHFFRWLRDRGPRFGIHDPTRSCFAPRMVYGEYVRDLLNEPAACAVRRVCDEFVAIEETASGVRISLRSQADLDVDLVVLATGHDVRCASVGDVKALDAWDSAGLAAIAPDEAVLIVGTGLTMVDVVLSLHRRGHRGSITAVSRRGLAPAAHTSRHGPCASHAVPRDAVPFGAPVSHLTRWLRENVRLMMAEGGDWRGAIDALRPHTRALWQAMTTDQRRRFLRHARPWWDVHRHRMAPAVAEVVDRLRADGRLRILAGRIEAATRPDDAIEVTVGPRGAAATEVLAVSHIVGATGSPDGPHRSRDPLIRALLCGGAARPDALGMSLDVTDADAVIDAAGHPSARIFAVGPPSRAAFWEMIAIPDIRDQCAELASRLVPTFSPLEKVA
jgi:uncharacterized NAD(P)/FAD-binding protein YdhS